MSVRVSVRARVIVIVRVSARARASVSSRVNELGKEESRGTQIRFGKEN